MTSVFNKIYEIENIYYVECDKMPIYLLYFTFSVVKEEISDDNAKLPCHGGRVVSWVWI